MSTFLIRSATSQSSSYPFVLTRLGGPRSRPKVLCNSTFKYHVSCTDGKTSVRIILNTYFSTIVNATFSTGLVVPSLQGTTRPVENVAFTMKGLQERKHNF